MVIFKRLVLGSIKATINNSFLRMTKLALMTSSVITKRSGAGATAASASVARSSRAQSVSMMIGAAADFVGRPPADETARAREHA